MPLKLKFSDDKGTIKQKDIKLRFDMDLEDLMENLKGMHGGKFTIGNTPIETLA